MNVINHPHTGEVYGAGPIIDAASKLDMHHILDQKARKTAIREAALLREMRGRIFINFMPNTIYDPEICLRTTMEAAHEYGVPLSRLVFEVVETEQIPDMKKLERILDYYRRHGVGTAVDDMGAGYASVEYLAALQPDFVKIDRDLVVRAELEKEARQKMDLVVSQAKSLGIAVIAEGIETPEQLHLCREAERTSCKATCLVFPPTRWPCPWMNLANFREWPVGEIGGERAVHTRERIGTRVRTRGAGPLPSAPGAPVRAFSLESRVRGCAGQV